MKSRHTLAAAALTILGATAFSAAPARAQTYDPRYPVCLQVYESIVYFYFECSYTSMAQCQMSASGRPASCVINPYYTGPKGKRSKKPVRRY